MQTQYVYQTFLAFPKKKITFNATSGKMNQKLQEIDLCIKRDKSEIYKTNICPECLKTSPYYDDSFDGEKSCDGLQECPHCGLFFIFNYLDVDFEHPENGSQIATSWEWNPQVDSAESLKGIFESIELCVYHLKGGK